MALRVGVALALLFASASLAAPTQRASWQIISPNLMDVAIGVSAQGDGSLYVSGGASGLGPLILRSEDQGATWTSLPHDDAMLYMDIDVTETKQGVTGGLGLFRVIPGLEFTADGESFSATSNTTFMAAAFQNVEAPRNESSYAVGFWQTSVTEPSADGVIRTRDNGATLEYFPWQVGDYARYGAFPSEQVWYITGGHFPVTTGFKGASGIEKRFDRNGFMLTETTRVATGFEHAKFTFVERDAKAAREDYAGVIAKTEDGGQTFQVVFQDTGRFYFNGISCSSELHCSAVAEGPEGAFIFTTHDGGATWQETLFDAGRGLFQIQYLNSKEGWAVGGVLSRLSYSAIFYHTVDGGKTWDKETHTVDGAYPNAIDVLPDGRAYATAFLANGLSAVLGYI